MTKEEILNGMSEEEFYKLYPTEEAYFMAKGGSLSGAPHNGQPTADEFFSYGAPALGHMNIPMSNPTYLAHGGTYFGGPIRPYQEGGDTRTVSQMWKEVTGLPWSEAKKNGITDGSYEANMQLRNALLKGSFTNLSDIGQAPRFRASEQEPQQEEQINPIAAGRTAANIMSAPTPQSLLVSKKPSSKVKATEVDKAITKTIKKAPPAKHIDAGAFQVVDNITGVTADYFKNSPLPGVVNTPNVNTPGPFLQKAKMEQVHMFPKTKAGTPSQLKKGPTDKRKIPQSGLVVDKRTNQAYYFGDKGEKGSFPVLTGANVDLNYNPYSIEELDKHPELRNTPTGYYRLFPENNIYGEKGFANLPIPAFGTAAPYAKTLATHVTAEPEKRAKLYKRSADNRAVSWGCINCEKPNINTLTSVFPKGDTALVLDSKRAADLALLQQAQARLNQQSYGGDITEYCWGGGLPGGANEMKRMDYGGYMDMGGYNSPTNYGSFSVPMNEGGEDQLTPEQKKELAKWAATEQAKLIARTKKDLPKGLELVKKEDARWTEPFRPSGDIYQGYLGRPGSEVIVDKDKNRFDSLHVSPVDPNLALFFKGKNKVIVGPRYNTQEARNLAKDFNKEYFYEKDEELFPNYQVKEYGGVLDASNNQDYPMMEEGGRANLMKIIKAASKKMKKEYATGGKVTMQGGNQNQLDNMNNYFKSFIQQNANNAFVEEEEKSFRMGGIPMAQDGITWKDSEGNPLNDMSYLKELRSLNPGQSDDQILTDAGFKKYSNQTSTTNNNSKQPYSYGDTPSIASMFKQLAQDFGPESRTQGYSNFPANFRNYWQMNKAGKESINSLPDNLQLGNLKVSPEYGALGRTWLGKKMGIGPKRINFELSGTSQYKNTPYKQGPQVQLADPNNPLLNPNAEQNPHVIRDPNREMNLGPVIQTKPNPGFNWNTTNAYGGLYKAQSGVGTPISMGQGVALKGTAPGGTSLDSLYSLPVASSISTPANVEQMKKQAGRETEQLYKTEIPGDTGTTNVSAKGAFERDNSGLLEAVGQYAVPGLNMLSKAIEAPGQKKREQQAKLQAMTPGSDTGPVAINPGNVLNTGDYDQWGNFRPNSKVAGPMYGEYGGMFEQGGFYEEGEEYDLSPEQMEYLRNQGYDFDILEDID